MSIFSRHGGSVVRPSGPSTFAPGTGFLTVTGRAPAAGSATTAGGVPIPSGWALQRLDTFGTANSVPGPVRLHSLYYEGALWNLDGNRRVTIPNGVINSQQQTYQHFEDSTWSFLSDRLRIQGRGQGDSSIKSGQLNSKFTSRSFIFEARISVPTTLGTWVEFWAYPRATPADTSELDFELLMSMGGSPWDNHDVSMNNHPYVTTIGDDPNFHDGLRGAGFLDYVNASFSFSTPHYYTIYYDDAGSGTTRRYIDGVLIYHATFKWNNAVGGTGFGPDASLLLDLAAGTTNPGLSTFPGQITSPTTWSGDMDIYSVGVYAPGAAGRSVPVGQAWDFGHKTSTITLSGGDLIATASATGMCFSFDSVQSGTGRYYWEIVLSDGVNSGVGIGLYSTDASMADGADYLGRYSDQLGWYANGTVVVNNTVLTNWATYTGAVRLCFSFDTISLKIFGRVGTAGNWNNAAIGSQNPAVGSQVGGTALPAGIRFNVVLGVNLFSAGATATMVAASGSWAGTPPTGFGQIGPT